MGQKQHNHYELMEQVAQRDYILMQYIQQKRKIAATKKKKKKKWWQFWKGKMQ